jgi:hypothetical protein
MLKPLTKKQQAQLNRFRQVKPLMKLLAKRIKLRAITQCAYADVLPPDTTLPDPRPNVSSTAGAARSQPSNSLELPQTIEIEVLADKWMIEEWITINQLLRPGAAPLLLKMEYCHYVRAIICHHDPIY